MRRNNGGFTLLEVLLVASLTVALAISVSAGLLQGIRIYERLESAKDDEAAAFFVEKITQDLKNAVRTPLISFSGSRTGISFARMSLADSPGNLAVSGAPVRVTYAYDIVRREVTRRVDPPFADQLKQVPKPEVLVSDVVGIDFDYDKTKPDLPDSIRLTLRYEDELGEHILEKEILLRQAYGLR